MGCSSCGVLVYSVCECWVRQKNNILELILLTDSGFEFLHLLNFISNPQLNTQGSLLIIYKPMVLKFDHSRHMLQAEVTKATLLPCFSSLPVNKYPCHGLFSAFSSVSG